MKTWQIAPILTVLLMLAGPLLARLHVIAPIQGFLAFAASALPGLVSVVTGIVLATRGDLGVGATSLVIGLAPLALVGAGLAKGRDVPRINDISTNLDNPPVFVTARMAPENRDKDLAYPEEFKAQVLEGYPGLISMQVPVPPADAFYLVKRAAVTMPSWTITRTDEPALTIEGESTAGIFQFTDDFVIRVLPLDDRSQIDMRSRSRVGKGDFGANAARISAFFAAVEAIKGAASESANKQNQ